MLTNHGIQTTHLDGLASWWARNHSWFSLFHQSPSFTYRVPIFGVYQVLGSKMEKEMATHSSTLAWKLPWTEEPGRLQSMGSLRVGHDWATSLSLFHFHALEKEMATHSSVLAWRIPGREESGGLPSMGSHRVRHDWSDLAAAAAVVMNILMCYIHSYVACFSQQTTLGCCLAKSAKWLSSVQLSHFGCLN